MIKNTDNEIVAILNKACSQEKIAGHVYSKETLFFLRFDDDSKIDLMLGSDELESLFKIVDLASKRNKIEAIQAATSVQAKVIQIDAELIVSLGVANHYKIKDCQIDEMALRLVMGGGVIRTLPVVISRGDDNGVVYQINDDKHSATVLLAIKRLKKLAPAAWQGKVTAIVSSKNAVVELFKPKKRFRVVFFVSENDDDYLFILTYFNRSLHEKIYME